VFADQLDIIELTDKVKVFLYQFAYFLGFYRSLADKLVFLFLLPGNPIVSLAGQFFQQHVFCLFVNITHPV